MAVFDNFPYTNFHELNLDQFFEAFKKLQDEWDSFGYTITATAHAGTTPNVEVSGDLISGLNFDFTLVAGDTGATGETGATGNGIESVTFSNYQLTLTFTDGTTYTTPSLRGEQGAGLQILDTYASLSALQSAHPTGSAGDAYLVGTSPSFTLYIWSASNLAWTNAGSLTSPSPTSTTPLMNGTADVGSETTYARGDHVHPTDTSRASATALTELSNTVQGHDEDIADLQGAVSGLETTVDGKQDTLISGTTIKTVASKSLLGSGNISFYDMIDGAADYVIESTSTTVSTSVSRSWTVDSDCWAYVSASVTSDTTSGSGYAVSNISCGSYSSFRDSMELESAASRSISASSSCFVPLLANDTILISLRCSKTGTKTLNYDIVVFGAALTEN